MPRRIVSTQISTSERRKTINFYRSACTEFES